MINKKDLSGTLGLSCVEKYFLAWLKEEYDVKKLYGNSFISIGQVFDDFAFGATYENYCYLPRLQDVAEEYGIVTHEFQPCRAKKALEILRSKSEKELCLIRVNTKFFLKFKRSSWREDHYICVDKNLHWINEYPLSEGDFTEEEFGEIYDGAIAVYAVNDVSGDPSDENIAKIRTQNFETLKQLDLKKFESAVGVLRITRKRMKEYYSESGALRDILEKEIGLLDKLYFKARMVQIKEERGIKAERFVTAENVKEILDFEKRVQEVI